VDGYGVVRVVSVAEPIEASDVIVPAGWRVVERAGRSDACGPWRKDAMAGCTTGWVATLGGSSDKSLGEIELIQAGPVHQPGLEGPRWEINIYYGL
jgi:hypothetical protein